jgi:hypothetical protein
MTIAVNVFDFEKDTITDFLRRFGTIFYFLSDLLRLKQSNRTLGL